MIQQLWKRIKRLIRPPRSETAYAWKAIETGFFAGLTLYLPLEWGEEVIQGQHEQEFLTVIRAAAPGGGVFYDIGAHYGWFSAAWLKCGGRCVEAFEPLAENRAVINEMLTRNGWKDRVHVHAAAVGRHTGSDWLVAYPGDTSRTFVPQVEQIHSMPAEALRQEVPIWTLADLVREQRLENPALIKIDVEGLEGDVIEGAAAFLEQARPALMIEVHSTLNGLRTADQLGQLGYQMRVLGLKGRRKSLPLVLWVYPNSPLEVVLAKI